MAVDWVDVGFNIVIGLVIAGMIGYSAWRVWNQIKKKREEDENELPRL